MYEHPKNISKFRNFEIFRGIDTLSNFLKNGEKIRSKEHVLREETILARNHGLFVFNYSALIIIISLFIHRIPLPISQSLQLSILLQRMGKEKMMKVWMILIFHLHQSVQLYH